MKRELTKEVFSDITDFHFFQNGIQGWHLLVLGDARVIYELLKFRALSRQVVHLCHNHFICECQATASIGSAQILTDCCQLATAALCITSMSSSCTSSSLPALAAEEYRAEAYLPEIPCTVMGGYRLQ